MTFYLNPADVYSINERIVGHPPIVRDRRVLVVACSRPMTRIFGADAYPTLIDKAAALLHGLAHDHPFADGNKRTATAAVIRFLQENGLKVAWTDDEVYDFVLEIAQGQHDVESTASWMANYVVDGK